MLRGKATSPLLASVSPSVPVTAPLVHGAAGLSPTRPLHRAGASECSRWVLVPLLPRPSSNPAGQKRPGAAAIENTGRHAHPNSHSCVPRTPWAKAVCPAVLGRACQCWSLERVLGGHAALGFHLIFEALRAWWGQGKQAPGSGLAQNPPAPFGCWPWASDSLSCLHTVIAKT